MANRKSSGKRGTLKHKGKAIMAEATKKETQDKGNGDAKPAAKPAGAESKQMGIRLATGENSDQPIGANYCSINVSPTLAFFDFWIFVPPMPPPLPSVGRSAGKRPVRLE